MQAPRVAARGEPCNVEGKEAAAEFVVGNDDDDEFEELDRLRKVTVGRVPTERQRTEHEEEHHSVHRKWCEVCVAARGTGAQHQHRRSERQVDQEEREHIILSDFDIMNTNEGSIPMLAVKLSRPGRMAATALSSKGVPEFGVKFSARQEIHQLQRQRAINIGTQRCRLPCVESTLESCPVGDLQPNGSIEASVREMKRQMRAVRNATREQTRDDIGVP